MTWAWSRLIRQSTPSVAFGRASAATDGAQHGDAPVTRVVELHRADSARGQLPNECSDYVMWDAAYVLDSLSEDDRREFEAHPGGCTVCRKAVVELSDMPALLAVLNRGEVAAIVGGSRSAESRTGTGRT